MTLNEAINKIRDKAEEQERIALLYAKGNNGQCQENSQNCMKNAAEYYQLAEWLEELRQYRDKEITVCDHSCKHCSW